MARLLFCISIAGCGPTWAVAPASREQILCAYDYIVEATVTAATTGPCKAVDGVTTCVTGGGGDLLDLRIDRLLARKDPPRLAGMDAEEIVVGAVRSGYVNRMESAGAARDALVGSRWVIALNVVRTWYGSFDATAWGRDQEAGIVEILGKSDARRCARLTRGSG